MQEIWRRGWDAQPVLSAIPHVFGNMRENRINTGDFYCLAFRHSTRECLVITSPARHRTVQQKQKCLRRSRSPISRSSICTATAGPLPKALLHYPETSARNPTEDTWFVLISRSGNRLPDSCSAAALELRDPWWQVFPSYASQVPTNRHPSLVDGPPSAERMVPLRGQN